MAACSTETMEGEAQKKFTTGDKAYVKKDSMMYEIVIQQVAEPTVANGTARYFVHYVSWNESFDEWVEELDLYPFNAESQQLMNDLRQQALTEKDTENSVPEQENQLKRKRPSKETEKREEPLDAYSLFNIPGSLKRQLMDEWETVTREKMTLTLPREYTVRRILEIWATTKSKQSDSNKDDSTVQEFVNGIFELFNISLGKMLLYRYERPQHNQIFHENESPPEPIDVYGAEHLLRLFVKLPGLVRHLQVPEEAVLNIAQKSYEMLRFLQKNSRKFFSPQYEPLKSQDDSVQGENEDDMDEE
ncbi:chromatin binding protein isoform 1 [Galdieria sulphuraria]|uniref:Chromatin binding protein isoform 1 n=1 Tax=Galdieria sulphuraria TaxID=130081 RepID=M2X3S4_GALSU|nr:chromatin binding protein isoform 1 [Galdieria sulphuraria]EME31075.1 chromatin binding protein isoform 1 [Galdieria sulphuraria]|eukprot:XP_005707595.1 chromatin binding protein isoform 1 [Galdieria sulphuraria]